MLAGIVIGLATSLATAHLVRSLLFGVSGADPLVLGGVALVLVAVTLGASFFPARQATRVDPMIALCYE